MNIDRDRLEALQKAAGLTGEALAAMIGITPPMLSRLKQRGSCAPKTAHKLAFVLGSGFIVRDRPTSVSYTPPTLEMVMADREAKGLPIEGLAGQAQHTCLSMVSAFDYVANPIFDTDPEGVKHLILDFIARRVPKDWRYRSTPDRLAHWLGAGGGERLVERDRVCAAEVWVEALRRNIDGFDNGEARRINQILAAAPGWRIADKPLRFGPYGKCRGFVRG